MSDRTSASVIVYDAPGKLKKIARLLDDRGYSIDWEAERIPTDKPVVLGQLYTAHEMHMDEENEVIADIRGLFEDEGDCLIIWAQTDPAYEYLGGVTLHVPWGSYSAECASGGEPVYTASQIRDALDPDKPGTLDTLLGKPYFDYLAAYTRTEIKEA